MTVQIIGPIVLEDLSSSLFDDLVHQLDQVRLLVKSLLVLGKVLDGIIHEVSHLLVAFLVVVQVFQEVLNIFLALLGSVWLVTVLQGHDGNFKALFDHLLLHLSIHEKLSEDLNSGLREVFVAKSKEEVVLQFGKDLEPLINFIFLEVHVDTSIKDLDMSPLEGAKALLDNSFLQRLSDVKRVPLVWSTKSSVLLSVGSPDVGFFLSSWSWVAVESRRSDVIWSS